eukprot:scaffold40646_cov56-Attheya_sp.AAC.2
MAVPAPSVGQKQSQDFHNERSAETLEKVPAQRGLKVLKASKRGKRGKSTSPTSPLTSPPTTIKIIGVSDEPTKGPTVEPTAAVNTPPTAEDFEQEFPEDGIFTIDVLDVSNADDIDGDETAVSNVAYVSGDRDGIDTSTDTEHWTVDTSFYDLDPGETEIIEFLVTIEDELGATVQITGTIKIIGEAAVNTPPTAEDFEQMFSEDDGEFPIDVLTLSSAEDVEGDVYVIDVKRLSGDSSGIDIISDLENWIVDTDKYALAPGLTEVVTYTITIEDEKGETVEVTGTIKIVGVSEPPLFEIVYANAGVHTLIITDSVLDIHIVSGNSIGLALANGKVTIDTHLYEVPRDDTILVVVQICYDVNCYDTTTMTITVIGV